MHNALLGGLSPSHFLKHYWHKKPLLVRQAVPEFKGLLSPFRLQQLACRSDVESRLIRGSGVDWQLDHGPFERGDFRHLPATQWTLLVQSLNHFLPAADALLGRFSFIPHARLDDLMVSYAAPGGSVGPHVDSYDVFLLQGTGRRRWQISAQKDQAMLDGAPLRILRRFEPEAEWVLEPGDMLYLPPQIAHHGVAVDACTTYSIGFRAPSADEIAQAFLVHLQDSLSLDGRYADPDLRVARHPGRIAPAMLDAFESTIARIRWSRRDVAEFAGRYLTEPKPQVFFDAPARPLGRPDFVKRALAQGVVLDGRSRLLFAGKHFFINGESFTPGAVELEDLRRLADARALPARFSKSLGARLFEWYESGWLHVAE